MQEEEESCGEYDVAEALFRESENGGDVRGPQGHVLGREGDGRGVTFQPVDVERFPLKNAKEK